MYVVVIVETPAGVVDPGPVVIDPLGVEETDPEGVGVGLVFDPLGVEETDPEGVVVGLVVDPLGVLDGVVFEPLGVETVVVGEGEPEGELTSERAAFRWGGTTAWERAVPARENRTSVDTRIVNHPWLREIEMLSCRMSRPKERRKERNERTGSCSQKHAKYVPAERKGKRVVGKYIYLMKTGGSQLIALVNYIC